MYGNKSDVNYASSRHLAIVPTSVARPPFEQLLLLYLNFTYVSYTSFLAIPTTVGYKLAYPKIQAII